MNPVLLDLIRDAVIQSRINEIRNEFAHASESLQQLFARPEQLSALDPHTGWTMIHGLASALDVAEHSVRLLHNPGDRPLPRELLRAASDTASALQSVRRALRDAVIPFAEARFGPPPAGTRWRIEPPCTQQHP